MKTNPTDNDILTVDQAAALLQVQRATFYRLLKKGDIPPGRRLGKRLRFSRRELIEHFEQGNDK